MSRPGACAGGRREGAERAFGPDGRGRARARETVGHGFHLTKSQVMACDPNHVYERCHVIKSMKQYTIIY